jgi:hypothetical protein
LLTYYDLEYQKHKRLKKKLEAELRKGTCVMTHGEAKEIYALPQSFCMA